MPDLVVMKTPSGQLDPLKWEYPTLVQPKLDGLRGTARVTPGGEVIWHSASGKPLWNLHYVNVGLLLAGRTGVFDGEIIWPGRTFSDAYGLCKRQKPDLKKYPTHAQDIQKLRFHAFDYLTLTEWTERQCGTTYQDRHANLHEMQFGESVQPVKNFVARDPAELERYYEKFLAAGHEGLMAKRPDGLYYWKRHSDWHRYKPTITADVKVIAAYEEEDKHGVPKGTLGGVVIEQEDSTISKCGGGFKAAERKKWWTPGKLVMKDARLPKGLRYGPSPLIGHLIEVEAKCRNESGALREPHFVRPREDKE